MENHSFESRGQRPRRPAAKAQTGASRSGASASRQSGTGKRNNSAGSAAGSAAAPRAGKKWFVALLIVLITVTALFSGVKLITGSSLPALLRAAFSKDYRPDVSDTPDFLPEGGGNKTSGGALSSGGGQVGGGDGEDKTSGGYDTARKEGVYNFLVCGVNTKHGMNNTDTMMVLQYNQPEGSIHIVQLPRDCYFSFYRESHNFHKINSYYTAYYNRAKNEGKSNEEAIRAGMTELQEFLEQILCIQLDYYVYVDLNAFEKIVDAVGGVTVEIPFNMDYEDPSDDLYIHLKKGTRTLDGETALQFVRFRKGYVNSDYGRMDAQKLFMAAFIRQVRENFNLTTAVSLASAVFGNLVTSIPADDFLYFAKEAYSCKPEAITMQTLPSGGAMAADGLWYDVICRKEAIEVINRLLNVYKNLPVDETLFDRNEILYDHESETQKGIYYGSVEDGSCDQFTAEDAGDKVKLPKK